MADSLDPVFSDSLDPPTDLTYLVLPTNRIVREGRLSADGGDSNLVACCWLRCSFVGAGFLPKALAG